MNKKRLVSRLGKKRFIVLASAILILFLFIKFPFWNAWSKGCPKYYELHIGYLLELSYAGSLGDRWRAKEILKKAQAAVNATGLTVWEAYDTYGALGRYTVAGSNGERSRGTVSFQLLTASMNREGEGHLWVRIYRKLDDVPDVRTSVVRWKVDDWTVDSISQAP